MTLMSVTKDIESRQKNVVQHWNYRPNGLLELGTDFCKKNAHVEKLDLKRNQLKTLPKEIILLTCLVELCVSGNELQELPPEIGGMKNLKVLDISSNYIDYLPKTIGQLNKLQKLVVSINKLRILPKEMEDLVALNTFEAVSNNLHVFPLQLCQCTKLQTLCLDHNKLKFIPKQIVKLERLKTLSISGNKLLSLPLVNSNQSLVFRSREQYLLNRATELGPVTLFTESALLQMSSLQNMYVDNNPSLFVFPFCQSSGNFSSGLDVTQPISEDDFLKLVAV